MDQELSAQTSLSHYRIIAKLGEGGMGEVYLAEDTRLRRKIALKVLPADIAQDKERLRRFEQEALAASALNHPNILTIYEFGVEGTTHYLASEFIDGETLRARLQRAPLTLSEALDIAVQTALALAAAHAAKIIHRDIKPENVMLRQDGIVKVLDFGLAKLVEPAPLDAEAETRKLGLTQAGTVLGTVAYMSPEQARGQMVDARSDIFSLGVVLYEMLAGRPPFDGVNALEVISEILKSEPEPLNQHAADVPAELQRIVSKALRKDRNERYQTARDLLNDLKDLREELAFAAKQGRAGQTEKQEAVTAPADAVATVANAAAPTTSSAKIIFGEIKRHKLGVAVMLALLMTLVAALGYFNFFARRSSGPIDSLAVLPFQNRSAGTDSEYLSDGLAESLIYRLSQLPNLKVSPTSSVIRYKGKDIEVTKIASELGVDAVMTGRLAQIGDNLTMSVELVDVRNDKLLWGEQYSRKMSDLLATQREIGAEIASKLQLKLSGESEKVLVKKYTDNNDAFQLYLKGRFHFAKRSKPDVERSVEYFKQAIALDPKFALAYSALAHSYNGMTAYPWMAPKDAVPLAKAAANRALELDPLLAEAHTALANSLACFDWNWKEAEREFRRALELNPNDAGTHWRYGMFYLMPLGRHEESIAQGKHSLELEPLDLNHGANLSGLYFYARRYDEALEHARQVYGLDSNFIVGRWALSQAYIEKGMYAEAIELNEKALQSEPANPVYLRFAGIAYAKAGRRQDAERILNRFRELTRTQYVMSYHLALIYSSLGDKDKAIAELETALREHDYLLPRVNVEPYLDPLRGDPRFKDLVKRMGLPE